MLYLKVVDDFIARVVVILRYMYKPLFTSPCLRPGSSSMSSTDKTRCPACCRQGIAGDLESSDTSTSVRYSVVQPPTRDSTQYHPHLHAAETPSTAFVLRSQTHSGSENE